jgi:hypothetical protein
MRLTRTLLPLLIAAAASVASAEETDGSIQEETYRWVQYVAERGLEARVATTAPHCPKATRDGAPEKMTERGERNTDFPIVVCTLSFPSGTSDVVIGGVPLALPKPAPARILLIGDTGCRIKGENVQACNDVAAWPFRLIADVAAEMKPDLVIHVGDYYYRETACPYDRPGCAGSPSGDRWATWREDFFVPAAPLLTAAPWLFVRGNHEACGRGGKGWNRLLDGFPISSACQNVSPSLTANIGGVQIVVVDVSALTDADEANPNRALADTYRPQFEAVKSLGAGPVWLAFHEPVWSPVGLEKENVKNGDKIIAGNKTLASAARGVIPGNVQAMLSGHIHTFEVMSYIGDLPIQIVSGNGGDKLEENPLAHFDGRSIDDVTIKIGRGVPHSFGFSMLERSDGEWSLVNYDTHGRKLMTCHMRARTITCD